MHMALDEANAHPLSRACAAFSLMWKSKGGGQPLWGVLKSPQQKVGAPRCRTHGCRYVRFAKIYAGSG